MGCRAQTSHTACGMERIQPLAAKTRDPVNWEAAANALDAVRSTFRCASRALLLAALVLGTFADIAVAQDPSIRNQVGSDKYFKPVPGGTLGPTPKINNAAPLYLQGDDLIYDTKNSTSSPAVMCRSSSTISC